MRHNPHFKAWLINIAHSFFMQRTNRQQKNFFFDQQTTVPQWCYIRHVLCTSEAGGYKNTVFLPHKYHIYVVFMW